MRQIHSQHFQICRIDEYWRVPYLKVSSCYYSSIYVRTPENVDEYSVFAYCQLSQRIDVCVVPPCSTFTLLAGSHTEAISPIAISPSNKAIHHLWNIELLQCETSCINESVLFISDILLHCSVIQQQAILL